MTKTMYSDLFNNRYVVDCKKIISDYLEACFFHNKIGREINQPY